MLFFGDENNKDLSEGLATRFSTPLFYPQIDVFPDGERRVRINENVVGQDVVFLKTSSITPNVDSFVLEAAFLVDSLKRSGTLKITGIIPYIPYSRADHIFRDGEGVPLEVVINLFEKSGLSEIVLSDPHTIKMREMFSIEVKNVTCLPLFAGKIKEIGFSKEDCSLVSPDNGGLRRIKKLSELLDDAPFVTLDKVRDHATGNVRVEKITGEVFGTCFVVDDMISSGKTIIEALNQLEKRGAKEIYVFATHAIFSENATNILQNSIARKIYVTDSIPVGKDKVFEKLEILTIKDLVAEKIKE